MIRNTGARMLFTVCQELKKSRLNVGVIGAEERVSAAFTLTFEARNKSQINGSAVQYTSNIRALCSMPARAACI